VLCIDTPSRVEGVGRGMGAAGTRVGVAFGGVGVKVVGVWCDVM